MENKKIISKCKKKQLSLIKESSRVRIEKTYCSTVTFDYLNVPSLAKNDIFLKFNFDIEDIKYEKAKRAAYIVRSQNGKRYFMKIKSKDLGLKDEIKIFNQMKGKSHKNVIEFIDYLHNDTMYFFIYEFIEGENMLEYIKRKQFLTSTQIKRFYNQLVNATHFLHQNKIIHCDLKLDNLMISNDKLIIVDFDLSKFCPDNMEYLSDSIFGTDQYVAPESYDLGIYTPKSDIWAIGIIFYIIITNKFPYKESLSFEKMGSNLYRRNQFKHIDMKLLKDSAEKRNLGIKIFIELKKMLTFNDDERINLEEIIEDN
jgi:serine/threonine protein kinase